MEYATASWFARVLFIASALVLVTLGIGTVSAIEWQNETVDAEGDVGGFTSLALDAAGKPRIGYSDSTNMDLKYAWHDGTIWHTETADAGGSVGRYASLALDSAGSPRISYLDSDTVGYQIRFLRYAWHDGAGWHNETVDAEEDWDRGWWGEGSSLALDAVGNPRISYMDNVNNVLKYAWHDAAGWHAETVGSQGYGSSLVLDAAGNPRIGYHTFTNRDLKYAWHDGTGWHTETVDAEGNYGGSKSLALDSAGNPRISYTAGDDLKYAWRDGTGWHNETVDAESRYGGTSLALDGAGNPRISYCDLTNGDLEYAWHDGAGWHLETVDAEGYVGGSASLALDAAGNPRISYYDYSNKNLKYAWAVTRLPGVVAVPGAGIPTDTNADGKYDDVNGNGRPDFADVVLYFNQMSWIAANEPLAAFDFNANGRIDFADVVWLFNHL